MSKSEIKTLLRHHFWAKRLFYKISFDEAIIKRYVKYQEYHG